ncbi:hypothetical protein [Sorangium sp. So ce426]
MNDDHPDAAGKHLADATALLDAGRHDGTGYLSGYVVECALKSVILHDRSFDPATGSHDATKLASWHKMLSTKQHGGHDLRKLATTLVGPEGARYLPDLPPTAAVFGWSEVLRYAPSGTVTPERGRSYHEWAGVAYTCSVLAMRADGVI